MNASPVERGSRTCYACRERARENVEYGTTGASCEFLRAIERFYALETEKGERTLRDGRAFRAEEHADRTGMVLELLEEQGEVLLVGLPIAVQETHVEFLDDGAERRNFART